MVIELIKTKIPNLCIIEPEVHWDSRGIFTEIFNQKHYRELGIEETFVQDNFSRSSEGVLRGLHFQARYPQGKLISVTRGKIYDVAVDIRLNSPTLGQWVGVHLTEENGRQFYIPPGFAHGFCVLSPEADVYYKCTEFYHPEDDKSLLWNDPELSIRWPLENPILSPKDEKAMSLAEAKVQGFLSDFSS
jgi:dTDP-4-dehydrorhamnose 3,5-epimerase